MRLSEALSRLSLPLLHLKNNHVQKRSRVLLLAPAFAMFLLRCMQCYRAFRGNASCKRLRLASKGNRRLPNQAVFS